MGKMEMGKRERDKKEKDEKHKDPNKNKQKLHLENDISIFAIAISKNFLNFRWFLLWPALVLTSTSPLFSFVPFNSYLISNNRFLNPFCACHFTKSANSGFYYFFFFSFFLCRFNDNVNGVCYFRWFIDTTRMLKWKSADQKWHQQRIFKLI